MQLEIHLMFVYQLSDLGLAVQLSKLEGNGVKILIANKGRSLKNKMKCVH